MKHQYFIFLLALILSVTSCKKFLDVRPNPKQVKFTVNDAQAVLDDYNTMNINYSSGGEIASDNYYLTDATYNGLPNNEQRGAYIWAPNAQDVNTPFAFTDPYKVVYNANLVLSTIERDGNGNLDQTTVNTLKGSALFFRAFAHFHVAQIYCKPYDVTASQDLGVPVRTSPDVEVKSERGTVQKTYDQIIKDLKEAIDLLPVTSSVQSRPNKVAAYAQLARVYLAMRDYPNAGIMANNALTLYNTLMNYNTISTTEIVPFVRFNPEVIFQAVSASARQIWPSNAKIDPVLYSSYAANDLRKVIFFKQNTGVNAGTYKFTGSYEPATSLSTFFCGLATDELYLTRAECYARAGNKDLALADLNTLLKTRWSGAYVDITAVTAELALDKILEERRKELIFRQIRWSDLRRLNKEDRYKKTLVRTLLGNTYELPPNDPRYVILIPKAVIDATGFAQNPR